MDYYEIKSLAKAETVVNKSRFIGIICPAHTEKEALDILEGVRKEYRDATHHCFAYITGRDREIMRMSDDKEPQGTAGIPILEVLKRENLTNVIAVCVRYFGGVLLGAGGLIRAYSQSAAKAVKKTKKILPVTFGAYIVKASYADWAKLTVFFNLHNIEVLETQYEDKIIARVACEKSGGFIINAVKEISSGCAECVFEKEVLIKKPVNE